MSGLFLLHHVCFRIARMLFCDAFSNIFAKEFLTSNRALLIEETNIPFLSIKGGLFFSGPWGEG